MESVFNYGACDFMSKPVQLYELQSIWRHVVRRRNELNTRKLNNPDSAPRESFEAPKKFPVIENLDHGRKPYAKRKDHTNEECEEKGKHDLLLNQKKRRVVWTQDLHLKFIAVIDKLGLENAVPKKILELMNDENLTRENVASHLQKHRLSLKKSSQAANEITSFGGSSNSVDGGQDLSGVVNNMQSMANNNSNVSSHSVLSGGLFSPGVTQWVQESTFANNNDNIYHPSIQIEKQNMLSGPSMPLILLESDNVKQPFGAPTSSSTFISDFPSSNVGDFGGFRHDWTPIQSPSMSCPSNDSRDNMLIIFGGNENESEVSDWNGQHSEFCNQLINQTNMVEHDLLLSEWGMTNADFNLLRDINIDDNSRVANAEMISHQVPG